MVLMHPEAGSLIIASATLVDPNFARCVLLILHSDPDGSLGVILNRPSEIPVGQVLAPWQDMTSEPGVLFRGGPVELDAALAIGAMRTGASNPGALDPGDTPTGWQPLTGPIGIVDLEGSPDDFLGRLTQLRVYAGYAGWGAEQLDGEIAEGSWHIVPAAEADLFTRSPDRLWGDVLRRQPPPLSMLATLPADANLN